MESDKDFESYIPWAQYMQNASLIFTGGDVRFRNDRLDKIFESASSLLLSRVESVFGPLYSFVADALPRQWQKIINVLYEKKCISAPRAYLNSPFNDEPKMIMASLAARIEEGALAGRAIKGMANFGASFDGNIAISKAIGEFLERYSLLHWKDYPFVVASQAELKRKQKRFLNLNVLAGVAGKHIDDRAPFRWVKGYELFAGVSTLLPAEFVFWNYSPLGDEPSLFEANTNGAGGMFTLEGAILSGVRELIQRDAFLIFWLNTLAPPRVEQSSLEGKARFVADQLSRYRFDFEILDITTDIGLPAFAAVLIDGAGESRSAYIGAGCEANPDAAIARALEESLLVYHSARQGKHVFSLPDPYVPFQTPLGHYERVRLWANPNMFSQFAWFLAGKKISFQKVKSRFRVPLDPEGERAFIFDEFKKRGSGYEIYYYSAPHPILKKLEYYAVKTLIPELIPLYLEETHARLGGKRLQEVPKRLGYTGTVFPNPLPHPFP